MKLSKTLLGAILVGVTVQATGCKKGSEPAPKDEQASNSKPNPETPKAPLNCPGCGMG